MAYADAAELARILQLGTPSAAQSVALQRVLDAAASEIDSFLGLAEPMPDPPPALVVEVNLERGAEHWKLEQSPFGFVVLGGESPPGLASRDSFRRHAATLLPLKESWGVA